MIRNVMVRVPEEVGQRVKKLWIARVDFSQSKEGSYEFGIFYPDSFVNSNEGILSIDAEEGDIIAIRAPVGQAFYQIVGENLVPLEDKEHAYEVWREQHGLPAPRKIENAYTILLCYPDYINDGGSKTYLAHVSATSVVSAQILGQRAAQGDCEQIVDDSNDFCVLAVFEGHLENVRED